MTTNPNNFMVVQNSTDESRLLGKFLYYSLADVLVKKKDFERICNALDFPYAGRRISAVDAFRNATHTGCTTILWRMTRYSTWSSCAKAWSRNS